MWLLQVNGTINVVAYFMQTFYKMINKSDAIIETEATVMPNYFNLFLKQKM